MTKERNALAELAEEMKEGLIHLEVDTVPLWVEVYGRAQRIIAELAKVKDEEAALFSMEYLNPDEARRIVHQRQGNCILKCHAIAEEGAKV